MLTENCLQEHILSQKHNLPYLGTLQWFGITFLCLFAFQLFNFKHIFHIDLFTPLPQHNRNSCALAASKSSFRMLSLQVNFDHDDIEVNK